MSDRQSPWIKFYPADWRADPGLRMCSYAARGLWMDMLTLMHTAEPYGHLLIGGVVPTPRDLAGLLGGSEREVKGLLDQLEQRRVFSRTEDGTIYSRRMVADAKKADRDRTNGKSGGNPKLRGGENPNGNPPDKPSPNPRHNGGVNPRDKAQKPEARSQYQKPETPSPAPAPNPRAAAAGDGERDASARLIRHTNPARDDPPEAWLHLADRLPDGSPKVETDPGTAPFPTPARNMGQPIVAGAYIAVAADQVCEAAGINQANWRGDWRPLIAWLRDGFDLDDHILPAIRRVAARPSYTGATTLGYFDKAVRERVAA